MTATRLKQGDVLEVTTPSGFAYIQYTAKHPEYGETVRVLPGLFDARPDDLCDVARDHAYFAFYPVALAARRGMVTKVGSCVVPAGLDRPPRLRRAGVREPGGAVRTWVIEEAGKESLRKSLDNSERRIPIAAIWNHEMLVQRLVEGWRPEDEG